jgi:ACS family tartrate transporter-like MFS transporter
LELAKPVHTNPESNELFQRDASLQNPSVRGETSAAQLKAITARNAWRIMPLLFAGYGLATLDKANIGFAALEMNRALGFSASVFGFGAGIFFLPYILLEVPSNMALRKIGARRWLSGLLVMWGLVCMGLALICGKTSFYLLRMALGAAEAGYFPGVLLYLSGWFPKAARARAVLLLMLAAPVAIIFGGPLSGLLLRLPSRYGFAGWQWLFIIEGLPAVLLGLVSILLLRDAPRHAEWLSPDDRSLLESTMLREQGVPDPSLRLEKSSSLATGRLLLLSTIGFLNGLAVYGLFIWLPHVIKSLGAVNDVEVGLLSALPFILSAIAMVAAALSSDRSGERTWHTATMFLVGGVALAASSWLSSPVGALICLTLAISALYGSQAVFFTLIMEALSSTPSRLSMASRVALVLSLANAGGFVGPYGIGYFVAAFGDFKYALLLIACGCMCLGALLICNRRTMFS